MIGAGQIGVSTGILLAWLILIGGRQTFRRTTLTTAQTWSFLAAITWTLTWLVDQDLRLLSPALADHLWYGCAVLALCPPIAVLGSRRPGTRVWTWFILLPMLFALCWPILAVEMHASELHRLQLETPQLIAFGLVLVMGVGNYCGTTHTLSALLYGSALLAIAVSSSAKSPGWLDTRETTRLWCTVTMTLAIVLLKTIRRPAAATRFDRLWFDFFDAFGIVWGRRIQDRVNVIASHEQLPVRLELHGFVWLQDGPDRIVTQPASQTHQATTEVQTPIYFSQGEVSQPIRKSDVESRIEHILRWLLRRFVEPPWIDERLGSKPDAANIEPMIDS